MDATPLSGKWPRRVLLAVLIAALLGAVWLWRKVDNARSQRLAVDSLRLAGGKAWYGFQLKETGEPHPQAPPPRPDALSRLVGEDLFRRSVVVDLSGPQFNDDHLLHVQHLTELQTLRLQGAQVTDAGLRCVTQLNELRRLYLGDTGVTDAGLSALSGLTNLTDLWLHDTPITDEGLRHLESLTRLEVLVLFQTQVTKAGVERLRRALPACEIACW